MSTQILRPHQTSDIEASYLAVRESMDHLSRWMPWCHPGYAMEDAAAWVNGAMERFKAREAFEFVISDEEGAYLGGCGLNLIRPVDRVANLGYWVRSSRAAQGLATAAAKALVEWAFKNTDLVRIEVIVAVSNTASRRVAQKLGADCEGLLRKRLFLAGQSKDALMFSILRDT